MRHPKTMAALALGCLATAAHAQVYNIGPFPLDGLQEVPPNVSPATGTGSVVLDAGAGTLSWNIQYSGLLAPIANSHFHGPAVPGVNAGVMIGVGPLASPMIGQANVTPTQVSQILNGLWYFNIHTSMFPGGEIRGQVVPAPAGATLLALAGAAAMRRRR